MWTKLKNEIKQHEGFNQAVYKDSLGKKTVGYGHLCVEDHWEDDKKYDTSYLEEIFEKDFNIALNDANKILEGKPVNHIAREAIIELVFNIGMPRTKKFVKCLAALDKEDYNEAGNQILDSLYARQVPARAGTLAGKIKSAKL
jgi:lysozyme|tara:strand:- start:4 stop:432 length:429 start_codon:yes stop_codon:yes gene_type:complete